MNTFIFTFVFPLLEIRHNINKEPNDGGGAGAGASRGVSKKQTNGGAGGAASTVHTGSGEIHTCYVYRRNKPLAERNHTSEKTVVLRSENGTTPITVRCDAVFVDAVV